MKLNTTSWHACFYKYRYDNEPLPKNFCTYFWKLVMAAVLIPINFFAVNQLVCYAITIAMYMLLAISNLLGSEWASDYCGVSVVLYRNSCGIWDHIICTVIGVVFFLSSIVAVGLFFSAIDEIRERWDRYTSSKKMDKFFHPEKEKGAKEPNIFVERVKAWKEKRCPIIEWDKK